MTFLVERLTELRRHLEHLREIRPGVGNGERLATNLSLHNDVMFSLLVVCQCVIDVAGELAGRRGIRFQDYTEAIRALRQIEGFSPELVVALEPVAGFRNILVHEYIELDYERVIAALDHLDPIDRFIRAAAGADAEEPLRSDREA